MLYLDIVRHIDIPESWPTIWELTPQVQEMESMNLCSFCLQIYCCSSGSYFLRGEKEKRRKMYRLTNLISSSLNSMEMLLFFFWLHLLFHSNHHNFSFYIIHIPFLFTSITTMCSPFQFSRHIATRDTIWVRPSPKVYQ